jgi:predicted phosphodiesterase
MSTTSAVERNKRILICPDTHFPYSHPDALPFLAALKERYKPTRIIHLGDEIDGHAISFHETDPDLYSPGYELKTACEMLKPLYRLFPNVDVMESNHGSLVYRRARASGLPSAVIKSYAEVIGAPKGWRWHKELTLKLPNGQHIMFFHGKSSNALAASKMLGMSTVNGHFHSVYSIQKWKTAVAEHFALVCGCLIDTKSKAFAYDNNNLLRPILGAAVIIDSSPKLEPMILKGDGRWNGKLY